MLISGPRIFPSAPPRVTRSSPSGPPMRSKVSKKGSAASSIGTRASSRPSPSPAIIGCKVTSRDSTIGASAAKILPMFSPKPSPSSSKPSSPLEIDSNSSAVPAIAPEPTEDKVVSTDIKPLKSGLTMSPNCEAKSVACFIKPTIFSKPSLPSEVYSLSSCIPAAIPASIPPPPSAPALKTLPRVPNTPPKMSPSRAAFFFADAIMPSKKLSPVLGSIFLRPSDQLKKSSDLSAAHEPTGPRNLAPCSASEPKALIRLARTGSISRAISSAPCIIASRPAVACGEESASSAPSNDLFHDKAIDSAPRLKIGSIAPTALAKLSSKPPNMLAWTLVTKSSHIGLNWRMERAIACIAGGRSAIAFSKSSTDSAEKAALKDSPRPSAPILRTAIDTPTAPIRAGIITKAPPITACSAPRSAITAPMTAWPPIAIKPPKTAIIAGISDFIIMPASLAKAPMAMRAAPMATRPMRPIMPRKTLKTGPIRPIMRKTPVIAAPTAPKARIPAAANGAKALAVLPKARVRLRPKPPTTRPK